MHVLQTICDALCATATTAATLLLLQGSRTLRMCVMVGSGPMRVSVPVAGAGVSPMHLRHRSIKLSLSLLHLHLNLLLSPSLPFTDVDLLRAIRAAILGEILDWLQQWTEGTVVAMSVAVAVAVTLPFAIRLPMRHFHLRDQRILHQFHLCLKIPPDFVRQIKGQPPSPTQRLPKDVHEGLVATSGNPVLVLEGVDTRSVVEDGAELIPPEGAEGSRQREEDTQKQTGQQPQQQQQRREGKAKLATWGALQLLCSAACAWDPLFLLLALRIASYIMIVQNNPKMTASMKLAMAATACSPEREHAFRLLVQDTNRATNRIPQ